MITKRIIPCLDVRNGRVVKGVNFEGVQDVSDPVQLAQHYSDEGADEIVFYEEAALALVGLIFIAKDEEALNAIGLPVTA